VIEVDEEVEKRRGQKIAPNQLTAFRLLEIGDKLPKINKLILQLFPTFYLQLSKRSLSHFSHRVSTLTSQRL
jgi:hypothetical protein